MESSQIKSMKKDKSKSPFYIFIYLRAYILARVDIQLCLETYPVGSFVLSSSLNTFDFQQT